LPRLAVLGQPIGHSRSPAMQNAALTELGLCPDWSYEAIEVPPERFAARVRRMPAQGFAGANVTLPHKIAAFDLADEASRVTRAIGAANTLSFREGRIAADNTDAPGFLAALGRSPGGMRALVLGAGGSARAVVWSLVDAGAEVSIWNRTRIRAVRLAGDLGASVVEPEGGRLATEAYDLIVNTTSVGMETGAGRSEAATTELRWLRMDRDSFRADQTVVDLVYGPVLTALLAVARDRGARIVDGLEVLVHQGAVSLRIWTGAEPPIETMRQAAREAR
jgi:shikimate dehydrogenase